MNPLDPSEPPSPLSTDTPFVLAANPHEQLLHLLLEQIRDHAVLEMDAGGHLLGANRTMQRVFGYPPAELAGANMALFLPPDQRAPDAIANLLAQACSRGRLEQTMGFMRRNGQPFQGHCVIVPVAGSDHYIVVVRDLSILIASTEQLHALATADQMTGLANREHLFNLGRVEYRRWKRYRVPLSLLALEADGYQDIAAQRGLEVGDHLLRDIADILKQSVRDVDMIARLDGGLFVCLLFSTPQEGAAILGERIRQSVSQTQFVLGGERSRHSVSLAVLTANEGAGDFDAFVGQARSAMQRVQQQGGDRIYIA